MDSKYFNFTDYIISLVTTPFCHCRHKAAIDSIKANEQARIPTKLVAADLAHWL